MLLQISTVHRPATDLGYLLAKNPAKIQKFNLAFGVAQVFYPEADEEKCTCALLLEIDSVALVRGKGRSEGPLDQYVNDRPYVASSFLSVALGQVFRSALNGQSREREELAQTAIPLEISLENVPGSEPFLRRLFEPLGYEIEGVGGALDENFPDWGQRPTARLVLKKTARLSEVLTHLYVLIPVLEADKHYFIGEDEVEKLLRRGEGWLPDHPEREMIVSRYLKRRRHLVRAAMERFKTDEEAQDAEEEKIERPLSLHEQRLSQVLSILKDSGARRVLDLGCGEGRLLRELLKDKQFEEIVGLDASHRALEIAEEKLRLDRMTEAQKARLKLLHGALTYRDKRLEGFDAAALVEVIEHLDEARLESLERAIWQWARPQTVVVTTPNREYNTHWETLPAGQFRHRDHRFEWSRTQFTDWAQGVAQRWGYRVEISPLGPEDESLGAPSQMAVFGAQS